MSTKHAVPADAILEGISLGGAESWKIKRKEFREIHRSSTGEARESIVLVDPDLPVLKVKRFFELRWSNVTHKEVVMRIMSTPGLKSLVLWRHESIAWRGDGVRKIFRLPNGWRFATDFHSAPDGLSADRFEAEFRLGLTDPPLTVLSVEDVTFDGVDDPPTDTVWRRQNGSDIRVPTAMAAGTYLYGSIVPIYRVFRSQADREKDLRKPTVEPETIYLEEM